MPGSTSTDLTKVGLSMRNKSKMFSILVGWVTTCVRSNSFSRSIKSTYWLVFLQSDEMTDKWSFHVNLG